MEDHAKAIREQWDGTDKLCSALYGRTATTQDYIGGANAKMLHDAAAELTRLRDRVEALEGAAFELLQEMEAIRGGAQWCDCPSFQRAQDMLYKHHYILAKP